MTLGARTWKLLTAGALAALGSCSLIVNSGLNGHPCASDGSCLSGYLCNSSNICVTSDQAQCSPLCSPGKICQRQQCVTDCSTAPCAPGSTCSESGGCQAATTVGVAGSPCKSVTGCAMGLFCVLPYGAETEGVCTAECSGDSQCAATAGEICSAFVSDDAAGSLGLCADPSLRTCHRDADCNGTPGFVCTVAYANTPEAVYESIQLCVPSFSGGAAEGASCDPGKIPCANGLCMLTNEATATSACLTPCASDSDCAALSTSTAMSQCASVPISGPAEPTTRAQLCILGGSSLGQACVGPGGAACVAAPDAGCGLNCNADAPDCVNEIDGGMATCVPPCTDSNVNQCPEPLICANDVPAYCL